MQPRALTSKAWWLNRSSWSSLSIHVRQQVKPGDRIVHEKYASKHPHFLLYMRYRGIFGEEFSRTWLLDDNDRTEALALGLLFPFPRLAVSTLYEVCRRHLGFASGPVPWEDFVPSLGDRGLAVESCKKANGLLTNHLISQRATTSRAIWEMAFCKKK